MHPDHIELYLQEVIDQCGLGLLAFDKLRDAATAALNRRSAAVEEAAGSIREPTRDWVPFLNERYYGFPGGEREVLLYAEAMLCHAAVLSSLLFGDDARCRELRGALKADPHAAVELNSRQVRNRLVHVDEDIDEVVSGTRPLYAASHGAVMDMHANPRGRSGREFAVDSLVYRCNGESFNLGSAAAEMRHLQGAAVDWIVEYARSQPEGPRPWGQ